MWVLPTLLAMIAYIVEPEKRHKFALEQIKQLGQDCMLFVQATSPAAAVRDWGLVNMLKSVCVVLYELP